LDSGGIGYEIDLAPAEGVITANAGGTAQIEENADARIVITAAKKK
jgi:hypothetical protein